MFKANLDTRDFDKVFSEYMAFSKRTPADAVNTKLYYIARNATMTTKHSDPTKIESELRGPSEKYPKAPLAAILVNAQLKAKGEDRIAGQKMTKAIEKLIKRRKASINFVRSGWKNAIKTLETYLRSKGEFGFARRWQPPVDNATMKKKTTSDMGKAIYARTERGPRVWGEIENSVGNEESITPIKEMGLQLAVNKEVASMRVYIERKLNEGAAKFNR